MTHRNVAPLSSGQLGGLRSPGLTWTRRSLNRLWGTDHGFPCRSLSSLLGELLLLWPHPLPQPLRATQGRPVPGPREAPGPSPCSPPLLRGRGQQPARPGHGARTSGGFRCRRQPHSREQVPSDTFLPTESRPSSSGPAACSPGSRHRGRRHRLHAPLVGCIAWEAGLGSPGPGRGLWQLGRRLCLGLLGSRGRAGPPGGVDAAGSVFQGKHMRGLKAKLRGPSCH